MAEPQVKIRISGDSRPFGRTISEVTQQINTGILGVVRSRLAALFAGAALAGATRQAVQYASQFKDASEKLGVGTDFLQEAAYAAKLTGASLGDVELAMKRLLVAQNAAMRGDSGSLVAFERFGISIEKLRNMNAEQVFRAIAAHVEKANPSAQQMADAITLMGRSADSLLPAFRNGFNDLAEEAKRLGLVLSEDVLDRLDEMGDMLDKLILKTKTMTANLVAWADGTARTTYNMMKRTIGTYVTYELAKPIFGHKGAVNIASQYLYDTVKEGDDDEAKRASDREKRRKQRELGAAAAAGMITPAGAPAAAAGLIDVRQDQFARMGLFVSAGARDLNVSMLGQLRKSNQYLSDIRENTSKTNDALEDGL